MWIPVVLECSAEGCDRTLPTHVRGQLGGNPGGPGAVLGGLPAIVVDVVKIGGTDWEATARGFIVTAYCPAHKTKPGEGG